jgi:predicted DNA-binding protein YlxM (UPF0122 family)
MNDNIIELEEYKQALDNKRKLDLKEITLDDLSLEEIEAVNKLYREEISKLSPEVEALETENQKLKQILKK